MKYNFIDLFCGAGGFSKGLELAGMNCIGGIDNVEKTVETHKLNHRNSQLQEGLQERILEISYLWNI